MDELLDLDAIGQAEAVARGDVSPTELVEASIQRIEKHNPQLNAVIHPMFEKALDVARSDDLSGPFRGVPMVVKDLDGHTGGDPFHAGMKFLKDANFIAPHDSYMHAKLRAAGFVFVGKTNTPELGLLPSTEPLAYGPTHNPWRLGYTASGSSGGSAAAVAARMVAVGTGGDGGGSIRTPASACGLFGLKPTRGRISLGPDASEAWAGFVVRGVLSRSVRDTAAILDLVSGAMPGDAYFAPPPAEPFSNNLGKYPGKLRIGLMTQVPGGMSTVQPVCLDAVKDAASLLESLGHEVEEASPPALMDASLVEYFLNIVNVWTTYQLDDWGRVVGREVREEDVEPGTWFQAAAGREVSSSTYVNSVQKIQRQAREAVVWLDESGLDLLLTPTMPEPPWELGQFHDPDNPLQGLLRAGTIVPFTGPFNAGGQPAMNVPLHWTDDGLPIGTQLIAEYGREDLLFQVASQLEEARPWADKRPPL